MFRKKNQVNDLFLFHSISRLIMMTLGRILFTVIYLCAIPALLLWLSGNWWWVEGWIFGIWLIALSVTTIIYLCKKDPDLLMERYKKPGAGNQKTWDQHVVYFIMIGFITWIAIMPVDAERFHWTKHFPVALKIAGFVFMLVSAFFFFRSFKDNHFLSPLVRVQAERKHEVVTTGVYRFVRHPMYLGALLMFIGVPMLLGSVFGIAIGFTMILLLAFRTLGEEKMLINELEGYEGYKKTVRYRFIPFIW
jgi:protein-S-isoprenylcysteine O-methyltransferase Ste14